MQSLNRSLTLEAVEDRTVPALFFYLPASYTVDTTLVPVRQLTGDRFHSSWGVERVITINDTTSFRVPVGESVTIIRIPDRFFNHFSPVTSNDGPSTPKGEPPAFDTPRAETSPTTGGQEPNATVASRGSGVRALAGQANPGNVAFAPTGESEAADRTAAVDQSGTSAARVQAAQEAPPAVLFTGQTVSGHGAGYATLDGQAADATPIPPADG